MPTANLREKINTLNQLMLQADLEAFQLGLVVQAAEESSGDQQVDKQLQSHAENARAQLLAVSRRIAVYQATMKPLQEELARAGS
jgi:hypothetical protein